MTDLTFRDFPGRSISRVGVRVSPLAALGLSAVALGIALQINFGQYDPSALGYLALAIVAALVGATGVARGRVSTSGVMPVLGVGLGLQFLILLCTNPMATLHVTSGAQLLVFRAGVLCAAACVAIAIRGGRWGRLAWWSVLGIHLVLGLWVLGAMPQPGVDVCLFQREAGRAILSGHNPYAMTFPNLYADAGRVYGAGTVDGGRLLFGFPYPPLSLLMVLPGELLGDFRISHLVAVTLAGAVIARVRPGRIATAAAALFLFTPRGFFVLEAGWTEPLAVLLFATFVYFAGRAIPTERGSRPSGNWGLAISLALLLVVKQYMVLVAPLAVWMIWPLRARLRRQILVGLSVAGCITVPMALWNLRAFFWSVVTLQFHQPVRSDALSFLPGLIEWAPIPGATVLPFVLALGVIGWACLRFPRTPVAFAAASALMFLLFFAFNKQAFCNYYFFVIGGLCCAIAVSQGKWDGEAPAEPNLV